MTGPAQRVDKWLWHARMLRTRSMASRFAESGKLRLNGARVTKASHPVGPGDVLTFVLAGRVRVLKVAAIADRRGPFSKAQQTYEDLSPPAPDNPRSGFEPQGSVEQRHPDALIRDEDQTRSD